MNENSSLLSLVRMAFGVHCAVLFRPDGSENGSCTLTDFSSNDTPYVRKVSIAPGRDIVGWILRHKQTVAIPNLQEKNLREQRAALGYYNDEDNGSIVAFLGCPTPEGGVLCIDTTEPRSFTAEDRTLLLRFAQHISEVLRAPEEKQTAPQEELETYFQALDQIDHLDRECSGWPAYLSGVLDIASKSTGLEYTAFISIAENARMYVIEKENTPLLLNGRDSLEVPLDSGGLTSWVLQNETAVFSEGGEGSPQTPLFSRMTGAFHFKSIICIPVFINRTVRGALCFASAEPHRFSNDMRTFTQLMSSRFSSYFEELYLKYRLQKLMAPAKFQSDSQDPEDSTKQS